MSKISRRKFFKNTLLSSAGIVLGSRMSGCTSKTEEKSGISYQRDSSDDYNIMKDVMKYRKLDAHAHVSFSDPEFKEQRDSADRLGFDWMQVSRPISSFPLKKPSVEIMREHNDIVHKAMTEYPNLFIGFFTLDPLLPKQAVFDEIKRCVDLGFRGYKGYLQKKVNDPVYFPIIEKLIDLKMLCFMHAECQIGVGGYRMDYQAETEYYTDYKKNVTIPEDFVDVAKRYPEAMFQWAHIGGGGDWEYMCKAFRDYPNIYVDTSGSNNAERLIDFALDTLGEDRLFFGTDNSYYQGVGKVLASKATEAQRKKIFFDNYNNILKKGGYHVA